MCQIMTWLTTILVGFAFVQLAVTPAKCRKNQSVEWGLVCSNCQIEFCDVCVEAGNLGCDKCAEGYYFEP